MVQLMRVQKSNVLYPNSADMFCSALSVFCANQNATTVSLSHPRLDLPKSVSLAILIRDEIQS